MKVKQDYISSQYHQLYIVFSEEEVDLIFNEVAEINDLMGRLSKVKREKLLDLVKEKIENEIVDEEIAKIDVVPIGFRKYRYLTIPKQGNRLLIIVQFCILPTDLQLKFPVKIPNGIFQVPYERQVIKDFTQQILLLNNQYDYQDVEEADSSSVVIYDLYYTKDDYIINVIKDQANFSEEYENIDEDSFINCRIGDEVVLDDENGLIVKAKVKEIKNKVMRRLSNEVVKDINFLGCKTVSEFRNKIRDVFTFSSTNIILLNYLADFIIKADYIKFDETVFTHFEGEDLTEHEIKRELVKEYIIWIINFNYNDDGVSYMEKIIEEYEFDKILFGGPHRVDHYQDFINRRIYEVRVLEYCIDQKMLDIEI